MAYSLAHATNLAFKVLCVDVEYLIKVTYARINYGRHIRDGQP